MNAHPENAQLQQVCYFYMPAQTDRPAEVITVINCKENTIRIPMPEEDVELFAFYKRSITFTEYLRFGSTPTWRIYTSWPELEAEHLELKVPAAVINMLLGHRDTRPLHEQTAVA